MRCHPFVATTLLFVATAPAFGESITQPASAEVSFEHDVRPILKAHCLECHGEGSEAEGGLDLRLRRFILVGGDSGPAVVEGSPDESPLLDRTLSEDMPPGDVKLKPEEIEILRQWVISGAKTLRPEPDSIPDGVYVPPEEREFWSFKPIQTPAVPVVKNQDQVRNPVDAFLLRRLEEKQLHFSADADRQTFIRRATIDLTGLPPTPEAVQQFVADEDPQAVENLIDRLLDSPEYGERWGRHWLDVVGYADSEGYTNDDVVRTNAYHYRDYVIRAFNDDMPFDQFIREQIAGDEIIGFPKKNLTTDEAAKLIATGFLRMVPDGTGNVPAAEQPLAQNQVMADALHVVGSSLLGLTLSCAQCHNHRYDPIPHAEYFQVRAIFEPAYDWKKWRNPKARLVSLYTDADRKAAAEIEAEAKKIDAEHNQRATELIAETLEDQLVQHVPEELHDALRVAYQTPANKRTEEHKSHLKKYPKILKISTSSLYLYDRDIRGKLAGLRKTYDAKVKEFVAAAQTKALAPLGEDAKPIAEALKVAAGKRTDAQKTLLAKHQDVVVSESNLAKFDEAAAAELATLKQEMDQTQERAPQLAAIRKRAAEVRAKKPKEEFVRALTEVPGTVPDTFLFARGDHQSPQQQVQPAVLSIPAAGNAVEIPVNDERLPTTGRRLAYAEYLTSGQHPLVARVLVNRFWMHHFGKGLVTTPSDFGALGDRPSHPELLDWLASDFMANGWSVKRFHKQIMTSSAYRQSLRKIPAKDVDPDNRLLSGMSLRRLEAETLRDSVLAISGQLNPKRFGPPVPVMQDRVGQIVIGIENLSAGRPGPVIDMKGEDFRRSVYVQVRRSRPLGVLDTFDAPLMTPNCESRSSSTVAPQSLLLMNSEFLIARSTDFAKRVTKEAGEDPRSQVKRAWELALCQTPSEAQIDSAIAFIDRQTKTLADSAEAQNLAKADKAQTPRLLALANFCQTLLSSNRFLYVD
ncbi:Planctomycete cytochrome C [Novipirellula galeiformis]|uniref:Planctomycete cytochrome C n=1 Tax=Novipirellula galeiformis TaxID=2528004 RepID=A0A5C6C7Z3_9BACT|nr:PSD1 and planctomycete cytochrome C domain-containing protein [Novipirellula galeiformis]TWU20215.1 Planctomycete cytochrome C [Novipirellula galeiformis]